MTESVLVKKGKKDVGMTHHSMTFPEPKYLDDKPQEKVIAVVSGGLDSTTMLYDMFEQGYDPIVLTFHYGQKHKLEIEYAQRTCDRLGLEHQVISIPALPGSALTDKDVDIPKEDYSVDTQKATVVPNRNAVFLNIAASYAIAHKCKKVFYAAHYNDQAVYPDCTDAFVTKLNWAFQEGNYEEVQVVAPFIDKTKAEIVKLGHRLEVPFEDTWSCYDPVSQERGDIHKGYPSDILHTHCGVCGTCRERKNAFEMANVEDPTTYNR